ncbi:4-hydroxy-tetrahydrodipicolinate synthase [Oceanospirillaceae bacterium]|jgi:4-hydroxy-tetrahydrodipicolinate synthase|nr:4-hydroxy-tetrahydrodipicolinate synthase [Oceanospirillaceae bacterium]MBT4997977.1 4-hydroxy-tetrahydrodipicolinate synthase [Oceanospirillaceae bacterium]MBT5628711.1 4-hydroxy-tetrahydrodipicolinate synthase [Oceanospirillaceae bacterium]MBT6101660.1 4-hydroxy-tetrahydrodipicolinate synthase [Oceanospirillaceae bacterium]MBT7674808.1 4-hydroxy-tetrahydrodipicolinate synthase [Oceanospirillaceae bacterium]
MFSGSYVALVTPFINGKLDETALRRMVNWQLDNGTHGLVPVGTTGESPTLSEKEHKRVVEIVVEENNGRVPVIAGAGSNNPVEALAYARHAKELGADAVLCVAGYYNRPNQDGLYAHFEYIAQGVEIPMIIYNIPPRAIVDIEPKTMAKLAALKNVVGVKDATGDIARISLERLALGSDFSYLSGDDLASVAYNAVGGNGCISVTANVAPSRCSAMQTACLKGDFKEAKRIHDELTPLHAAMFNEPSPAGVKYAASLLGLCNEESRLPVMPLSQESKAILNGLQHLMG